MHKQNTLRSGFTIVELLIVIVVIAILAAISIVAYTGIQQRARTAAHQHAASQAEREIMTYALQTNGESISLSGALVGYKEGAGEIALLKPLIGQPDITMYAVYEVVSTSMGWIQFAQLTPSVVGSSLFQLRTEGAGASTMGGRIDTSSQSNLTWNAAGVRTPGTTVIGWLQLRNNGTSRLSGYNQAAAQNTGTLAGHAGWNLTGLSALSNADGATRAMLVFNADHDQAMRQQVISWLAQKYGVGL